MPTSPVLASFIRGLGLAVAAVVVGYLMVPGNDLVFGSWAGSIAIIASLIDGIIEKNTGAKAFGTVA